MRVQYHFWPADSGSDYDAWSVHKLIVQTRDLPVRPVAVDSFAELDTDYWTDGVLTPRKVAIHARFVLDADPQYPIILGPDHRIMDGMHRLVRALIEGRDEIDAVTFPELPPPDYRNVRFDQVPYGPDRSI